MAVENPAAIARRAPDASDFDGGIDARLAEELIAAIVDYPTFETACAACGVTARSVKSLLERGVQAGAPPSLKAFTKRLARADADNARTHQEAAQMLISRGDNAGARLMYQVIEKRWGMGGDTSNIMAMLTSGKQSANLQARLERPSAMLTALFSRMLRTPNDAWEKLLAGAGWVRAMAEQSSEEEPEAEEPRAEDDGSGTR